MRHRALVLALTVAAAIGCDSGEGTTEPRSRAASVAPPIATPGGSIGELGSCPTGQFSITPSSTTIPLGASDTVTSQYQYVNWSSDDALIASVYELSPDYDAVIFGAALGTTCVIAVDAGSWFGSVEVTVVAPAVTRVVTAPSSKAIIAGQTTQLTATAYEQQNNPMTGVTFSWSSTVPGVATVSSTGFVTSTGVAGQTQVIAAASGKADTTLVTVAPVSAAITGSLVYTPPYPTANARLTWSAASGATSYKIFRKCKYSDGSSYGYDLWDTTSSTSYTTWDYVMSVAGSSEPSGAYFAYYVVASGGGVDASSSNIVYFNWDDVAEPGC